MTCIVALVHENKVLLGGDASASDDKSGLIFQRHDPKVFKVGQFGIGFVDSFRMGQILQYNWTPPVYKPTAGYKNLDKFMRTKFVESVKEAFQEHGYGKFGSSAPEDGDEGGVFIITVQGSGRIFVMDTDYHIGEADVPYMAEGSGQQLALGSLYSTGLIKTPRKRVRMALEAAAKFNMAVRGPFTIIEV
jgi:ATP-dependent protease HslVU (ClpYQ) peptidase subunit